VRFVVTSFRRAWTHGMTLALTASIGAYMMGIAVGYVGALSTSAGKITPDPARTSMLSIFSHNAGILVWLAAGLVTAGVSTMAVMVMNGMILGWVVAKEIAQGQGFLLVTGILPHLPLELGSYFLCAAVAIPSGLSLVAKVSRRDARTIGKPSILWKDWIFFHMICFVLLIAAAAVEAYISHA
jgi:uncharacterized membrane protein SpoIIM required for sporulation